jgi:hypothetical protein
MVRLVEKPLGRSSIAIFSQIADCEYYLTDKVLPLLVLYEVIIKPYQAFLQADQRQRGEERQRRLVEQGTTDSPHPAEIAASETVCFRLEIKWFAGSSLADSRCPAAAGQPGMGPVRCR